MISSHHYQLPVFFSKLISESPCMCYETDFKSLNQCSSFVLLLIWDDVYFEINVFIEMWFNKKLIF
jgi:hypothetical protein